MSRAKHKNCRWCQDRPGGCLYCVGEEPNGPEKRDALYELIQSGDVHVIEVRTTEQYLVHHVKGIIRSGTGVPPVRGNETHGQDARATTPCVDHHWQHDAGNMQRRRCTHAGCSAVQVWRWLPKSKDKNGEWVFESAVVVSPKPKAKKRTGKMPVPLTK